jgi:hypothetical protein
MRSSAAVGFKVAPSPAVAAGVALVLGLVVGAPYARGRGDAATIRFTHGG